jgi:hypothetical protein
MAFKLGSQNNQLVRFLFHEQRTINRINAAAELGIQNLTARIADLRKVGYPVYQSETVNMRGQIITNYYGGSH